MGYYDFDAIQALYVEQLCIFLVHLTRRQIELDSLSPLLKIELDPSAIMVLTHF